MDPHGPQCIKDDNFNDDTLGGFVEEGGRGRVERKGRSDGETCILVYKRCWKVSGDVLR